MMKSYANFMAFLYTYKKDERGVTAIEYGLIGVAMAVLLGATFASDGSIVKNLTAAFAKIGTTLSTATGTAAG